MNKNYSEEIKRRFLDAETGKDIYGGSSLAKLLYAPELKKEADAQLECVAKWFLLPHLNGRNHQGEPDFVAQKLIRALYLANDKLSSNTQNAIDRFFLEWNFESMYKSENHMLLFHSSRYLYAKWNSQAYFKQYSKSAEEILTEDRTFLKEFIEFRARRGWAEFDSLGYAAECFIALLNLIDFAEGELSQYAEMSANVILMDMIADCSKEGLYGGAHGRIYEITAVDFKNAPMCGLYQFYFGKEVFPYNSVEIISSDFTPADYVYSMIENRPNHWENYECKHLHSITGETPHEQVPQVEGNINKYTYVTPDYIMGAVNWQDYYPEGSAAGWYAHHQQHEWELTICNKGTDHRIFTHHPGSFGQEGKEHGYWTGDLGCCCGQFYCHKNCTMALYDIPEKELAMIHAHIPLDIMDTQAEGNYIWMKASEEVFAFLWFSNGFTGGSEEYKNKEIRSFGWRHGVVCMVGTKNDYGSLESFRSEVIQNTPIFDEAEMRLTFMQMEMTKTDRIYQGNAEKFPYETYQSPMMYSRWGSGIIETDAVKLNFEGFGCVKKKLEVTMEKILSHMLEVRPEKQVDYRPYYMWKGMKQKAVLKGIDIDFKEQYSQIQPGQTVFVKTLVEAGHEEEAFLNLTGNYAEVYLNEQEVLPETHDDKGSCYRIFVSQEPKELIIGCRADEKGCKLGLVLSTVYYRGMAAKDYLNHMNLLSPYYDKKVEGLGISNLYPAETHWKEVVFEPPYSCALNTIDFIKWYEEEEGQIAYAAARCRKIGQVRIIPHSECRILINGKMISDNLPINLKKGDILLLKSKRAKGTWGFTYEDTEQILELPLPKKLDALYGCFLLVGAFGKNGVMEVAYGPELMFGFQRPYFNAEGKMCYWVFTISSTYLRPCMDTNFFGQWFYALMVGNYGILAAAERLKRADLQSYFLNNMKILTGYYEYMKYDAAVFGDASFLQRSVVLDNLDSIGAIGLCLAEAYKRMPDAEILSVLYALAEAARNQIPRFPDGTYHRENTMWADDTFMSIPFLVRMGEITGNRWYYRECINQLSGFKKRLYMNEKQLFSHIYFLENEQKNEIPWGRGNGWVFLTLSDLLRRLPLEYKEDLIDLYQSFTSGVVACQDEEGMWHQVLDDPDSYKETSCTGMFVTGIAYGISEGLLEPSYMNNVRNGMEGLLKNSVTEKGVIRGVCRGSSCSMLREYYKQLGTVDDDDHGTGIILLAMDAVLEVEDKLERQTKVL